MKNIIIFILGVLTGSIITVGIAIFQLPKIINKQLEPSIKCLTPVHYYVGNKDMGVHTTVSYTGDCSRITGENLEEFLNSLKLK